MRQTSTTLGAFRSSDIATIAIATGVLTITSAYTIAQAESGVTDDLDTITPSLNGITSTDAYFVMIEADTGDTITLKHGTGNLTLTGATDIALTGGQRALLFGDATNGFTDFATSSGGDTLPVVDTTGIAKGSVDDTKIVRLEVDGITTATTRVLTVPDADLTIVGTDTTQTLTNKTMTTPTIGDFTNATHSHTNAAGGGTLAASAIASGTLVHERGGLEADVSAYAGVPFINGGSTSEIKYNHVATAAPTTGDDSGDGYVVGSRWIDVTNDKEYVCLDNTLTAAVWTETTASGGSVTTVAGNQVYNFASNQTTSSTSMTDVDATNAAVTITASGTRKELVICSFRGNKATAGSAYYRLTDGTNSSTEVSITSAAGASLQALVWGVTTSVTNPTYKLQFRSDDANNAVVQSAQTFSITVYGAA